jgi:tRNA (cmo5U34)-methyltransferase
MNETLMKMNLKNDVGKHDNLPEVYKSKSENQPAHLNDQLEMLGRAGFKDVDCFFKYSIFALFGGIR